MNKGSASKCLEKGCLGKPKNKESFMEDSPFIGSYCSNKINGYACMKVCEWDSKIPILEIKEESLVEKKKGIKPVKEVKQTISKEIKKKKIKKEDIQEKLFD